MNKNVRPNIPKEVQQAYDIDQICPICKQRLGAHAKMDIILHAAILTLRGNGKDAN